MLDFIVYADGSCLTNPGGPGGWAYCWFSPIDLDEIFYDSAGVNLHTTNNRMELTAAIRALDHIPEGSKIDMYLDSRYVIDGITIWIKNWRKKSFKNVKNVDLWKELDKKVRKFTINWHWVKGHSISEHNNFVDKLAGDAAKSMLKKRTLNNIDLIANNS